MSHIFFQKPAILTLYQMTKFKDWTQFKAFADDKINVNYKKKNRNCFSEGLKHCGKRRKCWLLAFSPFPTMFSKGFFFRVVKSRDCMVKSYGKSSKNTAMCGKE